MNSEPLSLGIWLLAAASISLSAAAQVLMKIGMTALRTAGRLDTIALKILPQIVLQPAVFLGLVCYGLSAAMWLLVLSRMPLSIAYPLISLGMVVVVVVSVLALGETIPATRAIGVFLIVSGVLLVGVRS